ncbi:hypothetical protein HanRHA438_Chr11g0500051 [Helianthus annuus]|uniref:Uncharacterized protein n=1 Tax=Helianthus annuus TaxID=4232 RepID=A0A251RXP1_HELAN|nr:hypothetical protein HanXRQr2_Chr16g0740231 [Helianthus annuus]KAF5781740.1 hypothetical protein HanXRQr2_Chr11g0487341 [Helianthus annuus]KAJ0835205.1 hypothetical protein HanRHA438_Chr16g0752481 [Helianthus annuus]KAJ0870400.1 hypothetical protein HanRHA438_Chr11g0500051 [Helianthus annuus]KAJ0874876.1 hypothetical protein HanPSC8_Chr11g0469521 [Helianthus annuus]
MPSYCSFLFFPSSLTARISRDLSAFPIFPSFLFYLSIKNLIQNMAPYIQSIPTISIMCETCNTINTDTLTISAPPQLRNTFS